MEKNVPEIRFKGFSGEWDEIGLLDSIGRIIDFRGRTPKKLGLDWSPSGYRALSALNVKQGYIDFSIDPHFGDQELYDKWMNGSELHQGQVLFTTEAPMGNVAQVPNADKYILSQRTIAFVVKHEIITEDFLAVLLRSFKVFRELSALSSGGTAKGVSQKVLSNLCVLIPTDLDEQTAIGNTFQKLDSLINQHQQKHDKLSSLKKAMLEKMFPKQGETTPEIRFKRFSGEWSEATLSDVIDVRSGKDYKHLGKGNIPVYGTGGYMLSVDSALSHDEDAIGIGRKGTIDKPYLLRAPFWTVDTLFYAVPNSNFNLDFLYCLFQKTDWKKHDESTGVPSLSKVTINNVPVRITNQEEQAAIGNYFQKLDTLINQHQQQITKLNNIKQACLSKMFV